MDEVLGEIRLFAGDFAPQNWVPCDGRLLSVQQYTALYSLLGIQYGGNGTTTFGIPDLRGRVPIGASNDSVPGRPNYSLAAQGGAETATLTTDQLPVHTHSASPTAMATLNVSTSNGSSHQASVGAYLAEGFFQGPNASHLIEAYAPASAPLSVDLGGAQVTGTPVISSTGGGVAHNNVQPSLALTYIICVNGIYPSRPD